MQRSRYPPRMSVDPTWSQKHAGRTVAVMLSTFVAVWLVLLLPFNEPWNWLMVGLILALIAASLEMLARFTLRQGDE